MSKKSPTILPLDKVNERIQHWNTLVDYAKNSKYVPHNAGKALKLKQTNETNVKLLSYWIGYKNEHYPNT